MTRPDFKHVLLRGFEQACEYETAADPAGPKSGQHVPYCSRKPAIGSVCCTPLLDHGQPRGLLVVDRESREPFSDEEQGRVAYGIKNPRGKQTHRVMSPIQFLVRLCALIPPPRHPLVRFHGVFAPHSSWRRHVVALAHGNSPASEEAKARACRKGSASDPDSNSDAPLAPLRPVQGGGPTALGARGRAAP